MIINPSDEAGQVLDRLRSAYAAVESLRGEQRASYKKQDIDGDDHYHQICAFEFMSDGSFKVESTYITFFVNETTTVECDGREILSRPPGGDPSRHPRPVLPLDLDSVGEAVGRAVRLASPALTMLLCADPVAELFRCLGDYLGESEFRVQTDTPGTLPGEREAVGLIVSAGSKSAGLTLCGDSYLLRDMGYGETWYDEDFDSPGYRRWGWSINYSSIRSR